MDTGSSGGAFYLGYTMVGVRTSGSIFTRFYFRSNTATPSADAILYKALSNGAAETVQLTMRTTGILRLTNAVTATTADSSTTISADTWYRIEVRHLLSDTVGVMEVKLYNDSNTLLETLTISGEDTLATNIGNYRFGKTASTAVFSFDDIAINDSTGAFQASAPGPGKIYLLVPNADVSIVWKDQSAAAASFARIDGLPTAVDDTDYNEDASANGAIDQLGLTNPGAEVTSDATIILLAIYGRVGSNQTSATHLRFKLWDESASLTNGPTITANVNGWRLISDTEVQIYDATGKTKANLDSFNVGYENITDLGTRPRRVSELWAQVEWLEAAPGPSTCRGGLMLLGVGGC